MGARAGPNLFPVAAAFALALLAVVPSAAQALIIQVDTARPPKGDADPNAHCDVSGGVLVPQASKATTVTHFGVGILNGVFNYRITCVDPDASFTLEYDGRPLTATCAGDDNVVGVDARAAVVDFDIIFWPAGEVVRPISEHRACGDESGAVPFAAAFADVVLVGGVPGAQFTYTET